MPSSDPAQRFADIIDYREHIERFAAGLDAAAFASDDQVVFAVKYALMIISEAAAKLGDAAAGRCPDIPWREIRGLGNRLRHEYETIDPTRLWLLIERDLPPLKAACLNAIRALSESKPFD